MALAVSYVGGTNWTSATSAPTLAGVALNTGDLLIAFCLQDAPFAGRTISSATWGANGLSPATGQVGTGGAPYDWLANFAHIYQVGSGGTATITFNLSGNADRGSIVALKATGFDTGTPVGDTDVSMAATEAQSLTLSGSAGDVALYGVTTNNSSADRWLEGNNSITVAYDADPRPGTSGVSKIAVGYKAFSGSSCQLGFTSRGFDAGPIDVTMERLAIGLVIKAASGGGGGDSLLRPPMVRFQPVVAQ